MKACRTLIENYVKPGKVSWEFRPYLSTGRSTWRPSWSPAATA